MGYYTGIRVAGGDTATPLNLSKRINIIGKYIKYPNIKIIDCGCGAGEYIRALTELYEVDALGIEYLAEKVAKARSDPFLAVRVFQGDLEEIPFPDGSFDLAILNEVLEHVPDEAKVISEIHRVLAPEGVLIVFSPNRWFPFETHGVFLKRSGRTVPPWVPFIPYIPLPLGNRVLRYWARNYWQGQLSSLIEGEGFRVIRRTCIWQTFENISGNQPLLIRTARPAFRIVARSCERLPLIRRFGASQVVVARKRVKDVTH